MCIRPSTENVFVGLRYNSTGQWFAPFLTFFDSSVISPQHQPFVQVPLVYSSRLEAPCSCSDAVFSPAITASLCPAFSTCTARPIVPSPTFASLASSLRGFQVTIWLLALTPIASMPKSLIEDDSDLCPLRCAQVPAFDVPGEDKGFRVSVPVFIGVHSWNLNFRSPAPFLPVADKEFTGDSVHRIYTYSTQYV